MGKNILVVGGDGFCGWPISLRLSNKGHNVIIVDNLARRKIDVELGAESLTKISPMEERISAWKEVTGKDIKFHLLDVAKEYDRFVSVVRENNIDTIIHLGEQRAAPYSMKNRTTSRYTVDNNLTCTHNVLSAIVEVDTNIHLVHIGTMGVYGYGAVENSIIPEGYVNVMMDDGKGNFKEKEILHPSYPGSIYHMTKTQDALFFQFYTKNWKIKITDLHQGIIWGLYTKETKMDPRLVNRFDYDSDFGTVLNRFIMQSATNNPITIYGTGGQTRAFIHLENSMDCIEMALDNPKEGKVAIFNQMIQTHNLNKLATMIKDQYPETEITYVDNPRKELVENELEVTNKQFMDLGLDPIYISDERIKEIYEFIKENTTDIKGNTIMPSSFW